MSDPPLNLIGEAFIDGMHEVVGRARASGARAILVRAEGEHFSAGADVKMFSGQSEADARRFLGGVFDMIEALESLPVPTIAAVQGLCLAGGLEVGLACDLIWAAEGAQLGQLEATIGAIPFAGGTQRLAARAGSSRALEMVLTGNTYPAEKMLEWGVVNRVVPSAELLSTARAFAQRLADGPTIAHAATKQVMRAWRSGGVSAADAVTIEAGAPVMASHDLQEGVQSLLRDGPRKATFRNR